ncbi:type I-E CRISPR-associated protein Cse2/CasB [Pseudoduganella namucuonensis]|uniref:CRISPR-associated protein, Cse2 family n=1 Tax=Pseudoduganella namucuonensis TaxID=1035707 RepID=A0A1I7H7Y1_9BURK|nr:type I-E CRISPR-associated protein Cse2/CasB [Pseudoduganella namucuonensis]SFU56782.1 CRISPR-associated protein, Cse2 family [Pseudoduganella namucuonensis]
MNEANPATGQPDKAERFVSHVLSRCQDDKGFAARLRRADNPATEHQSWELLATFGIPLEYEHPRLAYQTVAASIARAKAGGNGTLTLGRAIAACYDDGRDSEQARARLRRLLSCDDASELCRILRAQLSLIDSKAAQPLDYIRLLKQLLHFNRDSQRIKAQWAQEFYLQPVEDEA